LTERERVYPTRLTPIEPEHQRAAAAPNTAQRIGPCSATEQANRKHCLGEWRPHAARRTASDDNDDKTDELKLDAAAAVAEEGGEQ
jgi:hypothetical protein